MATVYTLHKYLGSLIAKGMSGHEVRLGTRDLECLRVRGRSFSLETPHAGDEVAANGLREVFIRAAEELVL